MDITMTKKIEELIGEWRFKEYERLGPDDLEWLKIWYIFSSEFLYSMPTGISDLFGEEAYRLYYLAREGEEEYARFLREEYGEEDWDGNHV